jgi:NAD(P)-dependent dehydrogenase (short-subunit alcohol dehydrogenase family)
MKLQGKVALVTGASSAIGQEIVRLFLQEGAQVVAADHFPVSLALLARAFEEAGHGALTTVAGDVSKRADAENMVYTALCAYGRLDIVVNNAGPTEEPLRPGDLNSPLPREAMEGHADGPMCICRKAIGPMLAQGGGVIVNVASSGDLSGSRAGVSYTAASHGLIGLTRSIALGYAAKGIRCNAISPSGVRQPEEMAQTALFLASDDSATVNGKMVVASAAWAAV